MTNENKKIVANYMKWKFESDRNCIVSEGDNHRRIAHNLDIKDVGDCKDEMVKRGDWYEFYYFVWQIFISSHSFQDRGGEKFFDWLFSADNFFHSMVEWLMVTKKLNQVNESGIHNNKEYELSSYEQKAFDNLDKETKSPYYDEMVKWHKWFAWYPVVVGTTEDQHYIKAWLTIVERRATYVSMIYCNCDEFEYREVEEAL